MIKVPTVGVVPPKELYPNDSQELKANGHVNGNVRFGYGIPNSFYTQRREYPSRLYPTLIRELGIGDQMP